jgi:hypothetical protein
MISQSHSGGRLDSDLWAVNIDVRRRLPLTHASARLEGIFALQLTPGALAVAKKTNPVSKIVSVKLRSLDGIIGMCVKEVLAAPRDQ